MINFVKANAIINRINIDLKELYNIFENYEKENPSEDLQECFKIWDIQTKILMMQKDILKKIEYKIK